MTSHGWLQIAVFLGLVFAVTPPLGGFIRRVFDRERTWLDPVLLPVERAVYRLTGVDDRAEMGWTEYAAALLSFSGVSMLVLYAHPACPALAPVESQRRSAPFRRTWPSTPRRRSRPTRTGRRTPARRP